MHQQLFLYADDPIAIFEQIQETFYLKEANHLFSTYYPSLHTLDQLIESCSFEPFMTLCHEALQCQQPHHFTSLTHTYTLTPLSSVYLAVKVTKRLSTTLLSSFSCVPDVLFCLTPDGTIVEHSPSFEQLTGFSPEDIDGKSFLEFARTSDHTMITTHFHTFSHTTTPCVFDTYLLTIQNTYLPIAFSCSPIYNAHNEVVSIFCIGRDMTQQKEKEETLYHYAFHDPLTGLPNRRLFAMHLQQIIERYKQTECPFALLLLDCDHFKQINDTYGHDIGDQVIQGFAKRIQRLIRKSDVLYRFGGDEYALLLPAVMSKEDVEHVALRIVEQIQEPWHFESVTFHMTTSVGIFYAETTPHALSMDYVLKQADIALYQTKNNGKNHYQFSTICRTAKE